MFEKRKITKKRKGFALILAIIFMSVFCALSVAMFSMSNMSVQIADNHRKSSQALCNAFSGLEFMRYYLDEMDIVWPKRLDGLKEELAEQLGPMSGVSVYMPLSDKLCVSGVRLNEEGDNSFDAEINYYTDAFDHREKYRVRITGKKDGFTRTIQAHYVFDVGAHSVFNYGIATKGPLSVSGSAKIAGFGRKPGRASVNAGVYIEVMEGGYSDAFEITDHASIAGAVEIANPLAEYHIGEEATVGGAQPGSDEKVSTGKADIEFPSPYPEYFKQYALGDIIDSSNKSEFSKIAVFDNCTIAADTDFTFGDNSVIRGVLYIETPNKIEFAGRVIVQGIIVTEGRTEHHHSDSAVDFNGQVISLDTASLPGESQFSGIRSQRGTFLLAPGFEVNFNGRNNLINGAIAANGISFSENATGTVQGSIINYSSDTMEIAGRSSLVFIRSGATINIPGFMPYSKLEFVSDSYREIRI